MFAFFMSVNRNNLHSRITRCLAVNQLVYTTKMGTDQLGGTILQRTSATAHLNFAPNGWVSSDIIYFCTIILLSCIIV